MSLPARVGAVLFDLDNTLVATEDAWIAAAADLFREHGVQVSGYGDVGGTLEGLVADLGRATPGVDPTRAGARLLDLLQHHLGTRVEPMPGAHELLTALAGTVPVAIASNSPSPVVARIVAARGWAPLVTAALGTADAARPKPAPDLYLAAAAACGADPRDCVVFEDSITGATAGRAAEAFVVTLGPLAAGLGDLALDSLTDPAVTGWAPLRKDAP